MSDEAWDVAEDKTFPFWRFLPRHLSRRRLHVQVPRVFWRRVQSAASHGVMAVSDALLCLAGNGEGGGGGCFLVSFLLCLAGPGHILLLLLIFLLLLLVFQLSDSRSAVLISHLSECDEPSSLRNDAVSFLLLTMAESD